jgi:hypothetical protein
MNPQLVSAMMLHQGRELLPIFADHGRLVDEAMAEHRRMGQSQLRRWRQATGTALVRIGGWLEAKPVVAQRGSEGNLAPVSPLGSR